MPKNAVFGPILGIWIYGFHKCFTRTMKESEFALANYMFFVEDSVSFPKQFSDRRSVHRFGGGDASKFTDKNDNREIDHTKVGNLWISQMFYAHYEGVRISIWII